MPFTQEKLAEYVAFYHCPYCGSDEIEEFENVGSTDRRIRCYGCNKTWREQWSLVRISEEDD